MSSTSLITVQCLFIGKTLKTLQQLSIPRDSGRDAVAASIAAKNSADPATIRIFKANLPPPGPGEEIENVAEKVDILALDEISRSSPAFRSVGDLGHSIDLVALDSDEMIKVQRRDVFQRHIKAPELLKFTIEKASGPRVRDFALPPNNTTPKCMFDEASSNCRPFANVSSGNEAERNLRISLLKKRLINPPAPSVDGLSSNERLYQTALLDLREHLGDSFAKYFETLQPSLEDTSVKTVELSELLDYVSVCERFSEAIELVNQGHKSTKRNHFCVLMEKPLFLRDLEDVRLEKDDTWKPPLLLKHGKTTHRYEAMSDIFLKTLYGPTMLCKVTESSDESDRAELLFQGVAACRLANSFRLRDDDIVVLAIFLNSDFHAEHYFIYPNDKADPTSEDASQNVAIEWHRTFELTDKLQAFDHLFSMYNYGNYIVEKMTGFDNEKANNIEALSSSLAYNQLPLWAPDMGSVEVDENEADEEEDISNRFDQDPRWKDLNYFTHYFLGSSVAVVRHVPSARDLVLKEVDSDEFSILQFLNSEPLRSDPTNHTIPIVEVLTRGEDHVVEMPICLPFHILDAPRMPPWRSLLCIRQLIEGVLFLHNNGIAHCDIKPDNAGVDDDGKLYIIDFGLARRVEGVDVTIGGFRGAPDWVAPEVRANYDAEEEGGEGKPYSPIRADWWAVGKVISCILEDRTQPPGLLPDFAIHTRLMQSDPTLRPSLEEVLQEMD